MAELCVSGGGFHILEISIITGNLYCPLCGEEEGSRIRQPEKTHKCPYCKKDIPLGNSHYCHG